MSMEQAGSLIVIVDNITDDNAVVLWWRPS